MSDSEVWVSVKDWPLYLVSNKGRVARIRPPSKSKGYTQVGHAQGSYNRTEQVHRLVYEAFIGPIPEGYWIHHKDGNKLNNHPANLTALDPAEHYQVTIQDQGEWPGAAMRKKGEEVHTSKLTDADVREIRQLYATKQYRLQDLADQYHVTKANVGYIVRRKTWKHVL